MKFSKKLLRFGAGKGKGPPNPDLFFRVHEPGCPEHETMKAIPLVKKHMTPIPHSIGADQTLATARDFMKAHGIRHLPVLSSGKLVGILTDRDIKMAMGFQGVNPVVTRVEEIALEDPYVVGPETKLDEVAAGMAEKKIGSALIVDHGHLVGIFTAQDALKALSELLRTRLQG
jgi:acetoin utilization protein AcuB